MGTSGLGRDGWGKAQLFGGLMAQYAADSSGSPKGVDPGLEEVTVYASTVDRMSGKETALPAVESRWPSVDRTKSPDVVAP